jgi:imidazolonepropionase
MATSSHNVIIKRAAELVTCSGTAAKRGAVAMNDIGCLRDGHVIVRDGVIVCVIGEVIKDGEERRVERRVASVWRSDLPPLWATTSLTASEVYASLHVDESEYDVIVADGACVMPGFIDSHTHFVFGGYREDEFFWRMNGLAFISPKCFLSRFFLLSNLADLSSSL